jgi:hypothetical protein
MQLRQAAKLMQLITLTLQSSLLDTGPSSDVTRETVVTRPRPQGGPGGPKRAREVP